MEPLPQHIGLAVAREITQLRPIGPIGAALVVGETNRHRTVLEHTNYVVRPFRCEQQRPRDQIVLIAEVRIFGLGVEVRDVRLDAEPF